MIPTFILNLLGKNKGTDVQKLNCVICDACRKVIGQGHGEYYKINGSEFCSLQCFESFRLQSVTIKNKRKKSKRK